MGDLPDWFTQIQSATLRATSIQGGLDADKSAGPVAEDVYLARDTGILYVCFVSGTWTNIGILYLLLAGGTMSGAIAMGTHKITGLDAPIANADAARKVDVDTVDAKLDDVTVSQPTRALDTIYQNTTGKLKMVAIVARTLGGGNVRVLNGSTSPPGTTVARSYNGNAEPIYGTMTFRVPPSWYYELETVAGTPTITEWTEWDEL